MEWLDQFIEQPNTWVMIFIIVLIAIALTRMSRWLISKSFDTLTDKETLDPTRYRFFKNAVAFIIWLVAFGTIISLIPKLKSLAVTLFAGAGILVAIVGFAAQEAFSNIIGGIFIVIFKPFRIGDLIKVGEGQIGEVEDITLRHTIIKNFENKRIIIPNSIISSETIINESIGETKVCRFVEFGISYDSDFDKAKMIIQEEAMAHPHSMDNRTEEEIDKGYPVVEVRMMSLGDFSVNLRAYVWTHEPLRAIKMHADLNQSIKKRFDKEGIEIPFPYRTIVYKNDLNQSKSE